MYLNNLCFFSGKSTALTRKSSNASDDNTTESGNSERGSSIAFKNVTMAREEDSDTSDSHHLPGKFDLFLLNTKQQTSDKNLKLAEFKDE